MPHTRAPPLAFFLLTTAVFAPERPGNDLGVFVTPGPVASGSPAVVAPFSFKREYFIQRKHWHVNLLRSTRSAVKSVS